MKALNHKLLSGAAAIAVLVVAQPALAQATDAGAGTRVDDGEIVVTARFKEETLQDVPQAISAFDERTLIKSAARDLTDLAPTTPNVSIQPVATFSNSAAIYIRGLGAQGIEST